MPADPTAEKCVAGALRALLFAQFCGAEENALAHDLAGLELDRGASRDDDVGLGFVRIAADAGFGQANFKYPEISQLDVITFSQTVGDVLKRFLDHGEGLLLGDADGFGDFDDHVAFGEICHKNEMRCRWMVVKTLVLVKRHWRFGKQEVISEHHILFMVLAFGLPDRVGGRQIGS